MPGAVNRSKTRTESAEELRAIADETRRAAEVLDTLYSHVNGLSKPVHATGWTEPIGSIGGFGISLRAWAAVLDQIAAAPLPDP